jgi:aryl-alcohol dehydrogenase-like predicted oxidoreductase
MRGSVSVWCLLAGRKEEQKRIRTSSLPASRFLLRPSSPPTPNQLPSVTNAQVEASLGRLDTSYLDILYVHAWDGATSIPELMQALNDLVRTGKVLYLGVADTPAWVVSGANEYARAHGMAQFVI